MSDRLLVLVRHGQSEWNLKNLFTGWKDVDLTEAGVAEARAAGRKLKAQGLSFDIEILEMHHNQKVDAPSGTALMLGRAAADGRGIALDKHSVKSRVGHTGARKVGDVGFATLRGGTVVGEHSVIFAGTAERVELTHKADDRMIFARGALHAARWARTQKPGLYSMMDVLGLKDF